MYSITFDDFNTHLQQLVKEHALELCIRKSASQQTDYYIPYMMNDAVECYYILQNCRTTGSYLEDYDGICHGELIDQQEQQALILHQGMDHVFTIWFDSIQKKLNCYRYHEIGHFWVSGQEQWRQFVYMIGTIYDKYEYFGETLCNPQEIELLALMEFAPFRYWSPIHESIMDDYPDTTEGIFFMKTLAKEAHDSLLSFWLNVYALFPNRWFRKLICHHMASSKGYPLYQIIRKKLQQASCQYPSRDYGVEKNQKIQLERERVERELHQKGYQGTYPIFWNEYQQITLAEEHPFTILDWDDFNFHIQYMISETTKTNSAIYSSGEFNVDTIPVNLGFFKGKRRKGWIKK